MGQTQSSIYQVKYYRNGNYDYSRVNNGTSPVQAHEEAMTELVYACNGQSFTDKNDPERDVANLVEIFDRRDKKFQLSVSDGVTYSGPQLGWAALVSVHSEIPAPSFKDRLIRKVNSGTGRASRSLKKSSKPDGDGWQRL